MKHALLAIVAIVLTSCAGRTPFPGEPGQVTFLYQSNRWGETEPCRCEMKPYGGIEHEVRAVTAARSDGGTVWYVDAGNSLAPPGARDDNAAKARAKKIFATLKEAGLDVLAPGPTDLRLGVPFLKELAAGSLVSLVSTNGPSDFPRTVVMERGGLRFGFMGVSPKGTSTSEPEAAIARSLPELQRQSDFVVLLSQLGVDDNERIAERFPGIHLIVGADAGFTLDDPFWIAGRTLIADPHTNGYLLGRLDLELKLPFRGFFSEAIILKNRQRLSLWENKGAEGLRQAEEIRRRENVEPIAGGTRYHNRLLKLGAKAE